MAESKRSKRNGINRPGNTPKSQPGERSNLRRIVVLATITVLSVVLAACSSASSGTVKDSASPKPVLGIDIGHTDDPYETVSIRLINSAVANLKSEGLIAGSQLAIAENNVQTQIAQIKSMILSHVSVILLQPISSTGLNGIIASAEQAGIPVLAFTSGPVTSTLPYELEYNFVGEQATAAGYIGQQLHGKDNVLNVSGVAGIAATASFDKGTRQALARYPGLNVVSTLYGGFSDSTTQSVVQSALPGLPKDIPGVITVGDEENGVIQAFAAAGRATPLVVGSNDHTFLQWWSAEHAKNGYTTISVNVDPGEGPAAVYEAYLIAEGVHVPKNANYSYQTITQSQLPAALKQSAQYGTTYTDPTLSQVKSSLASWACSSPTACGWA